MRVPSVEVARAAARWRWLSGVWLVWAVACRVYDTDLIDARRSAARAGDAGASVDAALTTVGAKESPVSASCQRGSCFWSRNQDGCESAGVPGPQWRPAAEQDSAGSLDAKAEIYLALRELHMTATSAPSAAQPTDAEAFGFDLDGVCTGASCSDVRGSSCRPTADLPLADEEGCRDNALSGVMAVVRQIPDVADGLGVSEAALNCELWRGGYNILLRVTDYNGSANDPAVRVDWYTSSGLESAPEWKCPADYHQEPRWTRSARFGVDSRELLAGISERGRLPASRTSDSSAYVRNGYLVSRFPDGALLRFAGGAKPLRGLSMQVQKTYWVGKLAQSEEDGWTLSDGMLAGRVRVEDLLQSLRQTGFCGGGEAGGAFFDSVSSYVQGSADVLASGDNFAETTCDALSFGIAFSASEVVPGGSARTLEPLVECCAPGMSALDCQPVCGDGVQSVKERCDTAIPQGKPGACPTRCTPQSSCEQVSLEGVGCDAHCVRQTVTQARAGDGCCPLGATRDSDADCASTCGNGVIDPGETCDSKVGCPICQTSDACTVLKSTGAAATCDLVCNPSSITACKSGDGCCPAGCQRGSDSDCSATCGDGRVDGSETCEPNSDRPCLQSCDDKDPCSRDVLSGSPSTCNVACTHWKITSAMTGDGCCPPGVNAGSDGDCVPVCGNGAKEPGEDCDDGNTSDGDGCSQACKSEPGRDMCTTRVIARQGKMNEACVQCVCSRCTSQANACYGAPSEREIDLCDGVVACARQSGCSSTACYCGADLLSCAFGAPSGPCRSQIERAAGTSSTNRLSSLSRDADNPFGRASLFGECAYGSCAEACGLKAQ